MRSRVALPPVIVLLVLGALLASPLPGKYRARLATPGELSQFGDLRLALPDGRGAGAPGSLSLIQTEYLSPLEGNVVLVLFSQMADVRGVTVFVDDIHVGDFDVTEGAVFVSFLDAGEHTFRAETTSPEEPSFAEGALVVLDAQPFGNPTGLSCEGSGPSDGGTCSAILRWTAPQVLPDHYWVLQDTVITNRDLPGTETSDSFGGVPAGEHIFGVRGFRVAQPGVGLYAGPVVETTCNVSCDGAACRPPAQVSLCQSGYGASGGVVRLELLPGGDYPGGFDILLGGNVIENSPVAPGGRTITFVSSQPSGPLTLSVRGACADGRETATVDAGITLLDESPLPAPVEGGTLACEFQAGQGLTATWRNTFPASFIDIHLVSGETARLAATVPGGTESIVVPDASPGDTISLQAFADLGGVCRGSPLASCLQGETRFLRGLCSGAGNFPSISDAVFALNYLFLGGNEPPCIEACDSSGDSNLDISDPVLLLNFLFLGGPPPAGWDTSGGTPVPACENGSPENCATAQTSCS